MKSIDDILDMLDWNNTLTIQETGRKLAKKIKCINVFLQPGPPYGKRVWDNCALILADRSDVELKPYVHELLEWLIDMNWPGAYCILDRLKQYKDKEWLHYTLNVCIKEAKAMGENIWLNNLMEINETD